MFWKGRCPESELWKFFILCSTFSPTARLQKSKGWPEILAHWMPHPPDLGLGWNHRQHFCHAQPCLLCLGTGGSIFQLSFPCSTAKYTAGILAGTGSHQPLTCECASSFVEKLVICADRTGIGRHLPGDSDHSHPGVSFYHQQLFNR